MSNSWKDVTKSSYKYEKSSYKYEKDWWKAPVLQGEENDYGEYDYMIEDIPDNYSEWALEKAKYKCDCCGKYRHLLRESYAYFRTMDGYDYMAQYDCWACVVKARINLPIHRLKRKIKKELETIQTCRELTKASNGTMTFWYCYKCVKEWKKA